MNGAVLLQNMILLFILGIVFEAAVSAVFSITAIKSASRKIIVRSSREALLYITVFVVCFFLSDARIFKNSGINVPFVLDYVLSSLVTARFSMLAGDLFSRFSEGN